MKNSIGMLLLGMGMGAGAYALYDQYKTGNLEKLVNKAEKKVDKMLNNMN